MVEDKIKVIYVAGLGHSGSTLMNLVLGSAENAFSLGEAKYLNEFIDGTERTCDCGENSDTCPFWSEVIPKVKTQYPLNVNFFEKVNLGASLYLPCLKPDFENYGGEEPFLKMLKQAKKIKSDQVEFLIDSSKDLRRLYFLNSIESINLYVVHIIRDVRGYLYSCRRKGTPWIKPYLKWILNNILIKRFRKKKLSEKKHITLSYDMFCRSPQKYVKILEEKFGLILNPESFEEIIREEEFHNFEGNRMRKNFEGIRYSKKWEDNLSFLPRLILNIFSWLLNRIWVYNKRLE